MVIEGVLAVGVVLVLDVRAFCVAASVGSVDVGVVVVPSGFDGGEDRGAGAEGLRPAFCKN